MPARFELSEYLTLEESSQERHEFLDGVIYPMTGGSISHTRICTNLIAEMGTRLKGKPCRPFGGDLRLFITAVNVATYPDISVFCGPLDTLPKRSSDTVLNPTLLVEVLSPSTRVYDRAEKFEFYQRIPSLRQYVLVHQDRPLVEVFTRQPDGVWVPVLHRSLDAVVELDSIALHIPLAEVFEGITFEATSAG
jgi:Uma2 family endonuclease